MTTEQRAPRTSLRGLFRTFAIAVTVVLSLLAFPSVLPWVIAFWIGWYTILAMRDRPGWLPLLTCLAIFVVKLVPRTPAILTLGCILLLLTGLRFTTRDQPPVLRKHAIISILVLWCAWGWVLGEWIQVIHCGRVRSLDRSRPIVCIGDSLTDGMLPDHGYPDPLGEMLSVPVVNLGFSGIATSQALGQMDRVLEHDPQVVVIEVGGHDFLKGHSRATTKANLVAMIESCHNHDAEVILMEIPRGFILDPFASLEREIAYEHDVELVADTWLRQVVVMSPIAPPGMWMPNSQLSDDGIHSNPRGSRRIAKRVAKALRQMYGDPILTGHDR
ncbi:GDSL-type esterase/lipase family protein [Novipirellula artificiosorum]|uniref:Acyl-CoA thioesterase I n=1 Tax=Novipirellula artificiosorum TaxID=2528016 RepID=A0A5C6DEQ9_9BACT|nr:GDSL-type esterase/lipase family protein [Novipirellula artificiosorum]TWU34231.1 Acyl-CoA thioesterase I precursor [Novipirellula artificiosorum]